MEEHAAREDSCRRGGRSRDRLISRWPSHRGAPRRRDAPRRGVSLTVDQNSQARSAFFRHFFAPLQQILDDGVHAGELRQMDTAFAAQALLNLLDPWTGREALPGGREPQELATGIVGLIVDGIGV